jgi:hypothetical protein
VLHDNNHADAVRLIGMVDVVHCAFGAAAGSLDDLCRFGGEVKVVGWVDARV